MNIHEKSKIINRTFDEMQKIWSENGTYNNEKQNKEITRDLNALKEIELFLLDVETIKTDLFLKRGEYIRNTINGIGDFHQPQSFYVASNYAKKWFPFIFLFKEPQLEWHANNLIFSEISERLKLFYTFRGYDCGVKNNYVSNTMLGTIDRETIKLNLIFSSQVKILSSLTCVEEMPAESAKLINDMVANYKIILKNTKKFKNFDSSFSKRKKEYTLYLSELLDSYGAITACAFNFYFGGDKQDSYWAIVKRKFFNKIRFINGLSLFVGYVGTWEFSSRNGYYFRVIFFIPSNKLFDHESFSELLIYHWETFGDTSNDEEIKKLNFSAVPDFISYSIPRLRQSHCLIRNKKSKNFDDFIDSVINYTVFAEKYFFPAYLQLFLIGHSKSFSQIVEKNIDFKVEDLKGTFSRSFRGHLRKSRN